MGFAPFLSPFTFGIPEQVAQEVIRTYRPTVANELTPSALLIAPTSPQAVPTLEAKLTALQLSAKNLSESLGALRTTFSALQLLLLSSGGLALFLALNFFVTVLFFSSAEQRQNMALLQILGAPRRTIQAIFLLFAGMLSIPAALLGTLSAFAIAQWGNHAFSLTYGFPFFFPAAGIFVVSPILFAEIILPLIVLLFLIGSIPAIRAARNAPLLDLQKGF